MHLRSYIALLRVLKSKFLPRLRFCFALAFFALSPCLRADEVHFAVIGDFGIAGKPTADNGDFENEKKVAELVKSWKPQFIITVGDNNYEHGDAETMQGNVGQFYGDYIGKTIEENRFFPSLGNHDWREGKDWKGKPKDEPLIKPYLDYFALPGNERYYDFARGPVHFFAIDSDPHEPDGTAAGSTQADWLKTKLSAATEPWKIVYFHEPPYSGGPKHGPNRGMRWPFKEWGVSVVLNGHEHNYQHWRVGELDYIVNGLGGGGKYTKPIAPDPNMPKYYAGSYGAMRVDASESEMVLRFLTTENEEIEKVVLRK